MTELLFKDEVYAIIGAAMEVHTVLGPGFLEGVYHEAMEIESSLRGVPFESFKKLKIHYKDRELAKTMKRIWRSTGKSSWSLRRLTA